MPPSVKTRFGLQDRTGTRNNITFPTSQDGHRRLHDASDICHVIQNLDIRIAHTTFRLFSSDSACDRLSEMTSSYVTCHPSCFVLARREFFVYEQGLNSCSILPLVTDFTYHSKNQTQLQSNLSNTTFLKHSNLSLQRSRCPPTTTPQPSNPTLTAQRAQYNLASPALQVAPATKQMPTNPNPRRMPRKTSLTQLQRRAHLQSLPLEHPPKTMPTEHKGNGIRPWVV